MTAKIKLNAASGGGSVSLKAPSTTTSNAAVELQLPVADGTNGQVLKTDGSGNLSFGADTGGKILQVVSTNITATSSVSFSYDGARAATPASVTITSSAANSKFIVSGSISGEGTIEDYQIAFVLRRIIGGSATDINVGTPDGSRISVTAMHAQGYITSNQATTPSTSVIAPYLDSPSQSSGTAITYRIDITGSGAGGTYYFGRTEDNVNNGTNELLPNYITVMEVAA